MEYSSLIFIEIPSIGHSCGTLHFFNHGKTLKEACAVRAVPA